MAFKLRCIALSLFYLGLPPAAAGAAAAAPLLHHREDATGTLYSLHTNYTIEVINLSWMLILRSHNTEREREREREERATSIFVDEAPCV